MPKSWPTSYQWVWHLWTETPTQNYRHSPNTKKFSYYCWCHCCWCCTYGEPYTVRSWRKFLLNINFQHISSHIYNMIHIDTLGKTEKIPKHWLNASFSNNIVSVGWNLKQAEGMSANKFRTFNFEGRFFVRYHLTFSTLQKIEIPKSRPFVGTCVSYRKSILTGIFQMFISLQEWRHQINFSIHIIWYLIEFSLTAEILGNLNVRNLQSIRRKSIWKHMFSLLNSRKVYMNKSLFLI